MFLATAPWSYGSLAGKGPAELRQNVRRDVSGQGILPTLGLYYLAAGLETAGHRVEVLDGYGISRAQMLARIAKSKPDVVGLSLQTPLWPEARALMQDIRRQHPTMRIAAGGAHANLRKQALLEDSDDINAVFLGNSEESFSNWVTHGNGTREVIRADTSRDVPLAYEPGFATRVTARVPWDQCIPNLMFLGHPRFATSVSTLGCASSCSFCALPSNFRGRWARPADSVLEELSYLREKRGTRTVNFMDDNTLFAHPGPEADELLERLIDQNLGIQWSIYLNRWEIDQERLNLMRRAGCFRVLLLAESGAQPIADLAHGRHVPVDTIARTAERAHRAGIQVGARFQIGFPGETAADAEESIRFAMGLPLTLASFVKTLILPGSRIAQKASKEGRAATEDERWSYYGRPVPPNAMSADDQSRIVKEGIRRFYLQKLVRGDLFRLPRIMHIVRRVLIDGTE